METNKIVFFDLDGTLLTSKLTVSDSSIAAIKKLKENGVEPIIATGRTLMEIGYILEATGINSVVAMNGQYVVYKGTTIYENPLEVSVVKELHLDAMKNRHEMAFYNAEKICVTNEGSTLIRKNYERVGGKYPPINEGLYNQEPIHLMLIFCEPDEEVYYQEKFPHFQFIRNSPYGCDIYPKGKSKATGIKYLLTHLNCSVENTYAFGDGLNDLEMFELVKYPVAMGNAFDIVKKSASYVTTSNDEDGIVNGLTSNDILQS
ncbi:Cof-type HAD-IIB family hydrolase [Niallia circulans]|uniref:Cof-type HAD-IIB family hydrolase n=1 Tax=Niallia circulans TaxID=1397 RepID=UPI0015613678|nr:Cof-type HAD-IIB family hydrolase [Niallia circulans]NRG34452.1 Cof-type HAD-IIB family hydrolase [Niallia circulans]